MDFFVFRSREPAFHCIFFVIANKVKQPVGKFGRAMSKKDAVSIRAKGFGIQQNYS